MLLCGPLWVLCGPLRYLVIPVYNSNGDQSEDHHILGAYLFFIFLLLQYVGHMIIDVLFSPP